jgi:hypothetical protein
MGWDLHFNPSSRPGEKKWEAKFAIGQESWFEGYELEPLSIYHIAVVRSGNASTQVFINGEPPGGSLSPGIAPSPSNFFIGHKPPSRPENLPGGEIEVYGFRASFRARYRGGFIPPQRFTKDADTLILLDFHSDGTPLKDLAGNHHGRISAVTWVSGTR